MKAGLARLGALFGLGAILLLGAVTGTADATTDPEFDCANAIGVVACDNTIDFPVDIQVIIYDANILTGVQLQALEEGIDAAVTAQVAGNDIKVAVIRIYDNEFDLYILSGNVIVIM